MTFINLLVRFLALAMIVICICALATRDYDRTGASLFTVIDLILIGVFGLILLG